MTEEDLIDRFTRGLKPHTQTEVQLRHPRTLHEAEEQALMVDDIHYRRRHQFTNPTDDLYLLVLTNQPNPSLRLSSSHLANVEITWGYSRWNWVTSG